jgi:hypothetical protein
MNHSRRLIEGLRVLCRLVSLTLVAPLALAQEMPARKAGLWQLSMTVSGAPAQNIRHCIDEKTDKQMQQLGQGMDRNACSRNEWRQDGDRYIGESECRFGPSTTTTKTVFQGDFSKSYKGEIEGRIDPPMGGMSQTRTTITARWVGACPAGWKPGDMEMPGGMGRINVNDFPAGRAARGN